MRLIVQRFLHFNPKLGEALLFKLGPSDYRWYDPERDPPEITSASVTTESESLTQDEDQPQDGPAPSEFAYERDLQSFLAKNLHLLEPGLTLYEDEGINGIEFDAGGRRIDILAVDAEGALVVIELKVSRGYDRVVGQLLRYMAWIEKHQADPGQRVRGIIVGRQISDDLKLATMKVPDVSLYEYQLAVTLQHIA